MATTVFIWNNNMVSSVFGGGHKTVGHAALHIDSLWPEATQDHALADQRTKYVSWWPGSNSAGMRLAYARKNLLSDMEGEGGFAPDHVIRIANLDEAKMTTEWAAIRDKKNGHYRLNVKNCSTVVARVLRAGATSMLNVYYAHSPLWTPLKAKRLAFSMGGTELAWTALLGEMLTRGAITASMHTRYCDNTTKRSTRHGNPAMKAKHKADKPGGLARWYK